MSDEYQGEFAWGGRIEVHSFKANKQTKKTLPKMINSQAFIILFDTKLYKSWIPPKKSFHHSVKSQLRDLLRIYHLDHN